MSNHLDAPHADRDPGRNAVTHGLTARRPLHEEEAERLILISEQWVTAHMPETESEEALIRAAACEYVRYLRCVDAEERRMAPAIREALEQWEDRRRHAIRRKAQDLLQDPGRVAAELHRSAFGLDWLLNRWRNLHARLLDGRGWTGIELEGAMMLLGRRPERPAAADAAARGLWDAVEAACPQLTEPLTAPPRPGRPADAEAAGRALAFLAARIAELEALRPKAWEEVEAPMAAAVEVEALQDVSKEGQLRNRYRREAYGDMARALRLVTQIKSDRSRNAAREMTVFGSVGASRPAVPFVPPPAAPSPPPPPSPAAESRNEPPGAADAPREIRRNPNPSEWFRPTSSVDADDPRWRTWGRAEAHPGRTEGAESPPEGLGSAPPRVPDGDRRA